MTKNLEPGLLIRRVLIASLAFGELRFCECSAPANPTGGTVSQGAATINTSGSQLTVNQSSPSAYLNWQSFNINAGESVIFNQPSSSSVAWNYIGDANPSTINGNLTANGYVILQNPNGFTVGGSAAITAHGLIMTTASTPNLNLFDGGAWSFDAPPPTAKIVNYGQINITGGGSAFLIADDIENNGTISAPGGQIGLYAGQQVLLSLAPDGRGLSTEVTLPQGSVDNEGKLVADAGSIVAQAKTVNQNGYVQANSVQNVNGTIELLASDTVNLGANSAISAQGGSQGASTGGSVTIKAGNTFSDQAGSSINIAGGAQGGNGGQVEISAPQMSSINSTINGSAAYDYIDGTLFIDPANILLTSSGGTAPASGTVNSGDAPANGTLTINPNSFASTLSTINLSASQNIEVATGWNLSDQSSAATLNLNAGNNITVDSGAFISAGKDWTINLNAGTAYTGSTAPASGSDGIYLDGSAYIQTENGNINATAANEVILGTGAIRTIGISNPSGGNFDGGNINVTTTFGDVNSGLGTGGYTFLTTENSASSTYYTPSANLSGIATAAGGNINITAGGDVISYPTADTATVGNLSSIGGLEESDPGIGAFGYQSGNVNITAHGGVYGNFIVANGTGTINAAGDIGNSAANVALSLVSGGWNLNAQGNIYLQEVRNPNGVFNNTKKSALSSSPSAGNHQFDYSLTAYTDLTAGDGVYITGSDLPRINDGVPLVLPPILIINAGAGGVNLETPSFPSTVSVASDANSITLYPSPYADIDITTTDGGWLTSDNGGSAATLYMSDSGQTKWTTSNDAFGESDHGTTPPDTENVTPITLNVQGGPITLDNATPATINLSGGQASMNNVILSFDKSAQISLPGDMVNCTFYAENLQANAVSSLNVGGEIVNSTSFSFTPLDAAFPTLGTLGLPSGITDLPLGTVQAWDTLFELAVDPSTFSSEIFSTSDSQQNLAAIQSYILNHHAFPGIDFSDVTYDPATQTLIVAGPLSAANNVAAALESTTLYLPEYYLNGLPVLNTSGLTTGAILQLATVHLSVLNVPIIQTLASQNAPQAYTSSGAYVVAGTGQFDITAGSINLGESDGILTVGDGTPILGNNYSTLAPYITTGASINIQTSSIQMDSSTIATLAGGDINITATGFIPNGAVNNNGVGTSLDLGDPRLVPFEQNLLTANGQIGLGIYTTSGGNVTINSLGTVNIDSSQVSTFDGGNIYIQSLAGDVNAGSGSTLATPVYSFLPKYAFPYEPQESVYANGIVADTLSPPPGGFPKATQPYVATKPGNITVITPQGSIYANLGGILQENLGGDLLPGPYIDLEAGTPAGGDWSSTATPIYVGNVELGNFGAIGGTVNVEATGNISGLLISAQNANVVGQGIGNLTVLAIGVANVSSQSSSGGVTIIGGQGVNATGVGSGALLLGQNVSVNGAAAQSTLGTSAGATAASQSAAQQSAQAAQQVASTDTSGDSDDQKKKKPATLRTKRVTVLLGAAVPGH